jgi:hypothetical protein
MDLPQAPIFFAPFHYFPKFMVYTERVALFPALLRHCRVNEEEAMKQRESLFIVVALSSLLSVAGQVQAAPYSFSVDRFEVTGQVAKVDEFDDGVLVPDWVVVNPTVMESGGVVTLSSPGGIIGPNEQETELVTVFTSPFTVFDGSGNFTGTSTWVTGLPGVNLSYEMTVNHNVPDGNGGFLDEFFSIGLTNLDAATAASLGAPAGPLVFFAREIGNDFIDPQVLAINPADVNGNILLRLAFDDTNDLFSGAFSLNGGTSFQTFATPLSPTQGQTDYQWALMAGAVPEPETYAMMLAGLGLVGFMARRRKALVA